jgi:hypothetical protein
MELYRELRDTPVLSVYLEADRHDPAERRVWAKELEHLLDEERRRVEAASPEALGDYDAARGHVLERLGGFSGFLPDRGWVGFATGSGMVYGESVPVPMPNLVRWEAGIRAAPYVRALKQARPVVGVLADSRKARVFIYLDGEAEEHIDLMAEGLPDDVLDVNVSKRAATHSGVRGKTSTDTARASQAKNAARMHARLVELIEENAGKEGFVVVGGPAAVVASVAQQASHLAERLLERPSLHLGMSESEVKIAVEEAASELSRRAQERLLNEIIDLSKSGGRGCLGPEDTEVALRERRVETLLLSRQFRERSPDTADHCVGTAFEQNANVEELSGAGAERLEAEGEGIGARLRYVV